ncbi:AMP-binding protein [Aquirufa antheringensis]|uniref:AMP-binding protein n=1 Tax=Aquirufa antheringensis TaxID=2516559 RepID=UPI00208F206E|nr:AMP-binding protein [Aquirufa antheringensis]USQ03352.1 long-chain fatty acid--CoA ligase [Aquirufa antheringensis]
MIKYFIRDEHLNTQKSFADFLKDLSATSDYCKVYRYTRFYDFFVNLIKALINNKNIVLIDSGFTDQEIINLGFFQELNKAESVGDNNSIRDGFDLIERLKNSHSKLTLFTSGTTGLPKLVEHNIPTLTRMVRSGDKYINDVWGLAFNPTHIAGIQVLLQALLNLNSIVHVFGLPSNRVAWSIKHNKITHLSATPTFYRLLVSTKEVFPYVQRITLGGEKSDPKLYADINTSFPNAKINNIYASTELGSLFVANGDLFSVPNSIRESVRVSDGELQIRTSLINSDRDNEWYQTGDIVEVVNVDPLQFKFKNRKTEMINVGGYKVNPNEIEDAVRLYSELSDVRVYGKPNSVLGNILCMDFVLSEGAIVDATEIKKRLSLQFQDYNIPRIIKQVFEIQKTRTGKLSRI